MKANGKKCRNLLKNIYMLRKKHARLYVSFDKSHFPLLCHASRLHQYKCDCAERGCRVSECRVSVESVDVESVQSQCRGGVQCGCRGSLSVKCIGDVVQCDCSRAVFSMGTSQCECRTRHLQSNIRGHLRTHLITAKKAVTQFCNDVVLASSSTW